MQKTLMTVVLLAAGVALSLVAQGEVPEPVPSPEPGAAYLSDDYAARDCLVAQWDAIDNVALGQHSDTAIAWTDLSGNGHTLSNFLTEVTWTENAFATPTNAYKKAAEVTGAAIGLNDFKAYEIVFAADGDIPQWSGLVFGTSNFKGLVLCNGTQSVGRGFQVVGNGSTFLCDYDITGKFQQLYTDYDDNGSPKSAYYNGEALGTSTLNESWSQGAFGIGYASNAKWPYYGRISTIRLYSRRLTDAEREHNRRIDDARYLQKDSARIPLEFRSGKIVATVPATYAGRTVRLYANASYGGTDDWGAAVATAVVPSGGTTVTFEKPSGWGETVWYARAQIGDGWQAVWTKTLMPEPPATLGMNAALSLASSAVGSSEIAAQVTGLGETASEATLTFRYGATQDLADGTVEVTVTDAGEWRGTIPHLREEIGCYVQATLSNGVDADVTSAVYAFVQPHVVEDGTCSSDAYAQRDHLVVFWDGIDSAAARKRGASAATWTDSTGNGFDWTLIGGRYEWTDRGLWLKKVNRVGSLAQTPADFEYKVSTIEFVYANKEKVHGIIFGPGFGAAAYLYTDTSGRVGFYGPADATKRVGTPVALNATNCFSVVYDRNGARPSGVTDFRVNDVLGTAEGMGDYWGSGMDTPTLGDRSSGGVPAGGELFAIRIYDVALTDAERRQNYQIDVMRYLRGIVSGVSLALAGDCIRATVAESDAPQTVVLYWGENYGGTGPWAASSSATVPVGETTATFPKPSGWGSTVWFARAKSGEGDDAVWSQTLVAADVTRPSVTLGEADGTGGDTLVVKGTVDALGAGNCTLKVYTGTSADALDCVWAGLDGSSVTATGDFALTLFENDKGAARYFAPGETYYVQVEVKDSAGKATRSAVESVTMANEPTFGTPTATIPSGRQMTVTATMTNLGMAGRTTVELWVGADANSLARQDSVAVAAAGSGFTLSCTLPEYETTYVWQLKAVNESAGKTASANVSTPVADILAQDTATYTWKAAARDGLWSDPANWSSSQPTDCLGYPRSTGATAVFPAETRASVTLDGSYSIKKIDLSAANISVAFIGTDVETCRLTSSSIGWLGSCSKLILDGVYFERVQDLGPIAGGAVILRNGAIWKLNILDYYTRQWFERQNSVLEITQGSEVRASGLRIGVDAKIVIDDATLSVSGAVQAGYSAAGGGIVFKGKHPLLKVASGSKFNSELADAGVTLDFEVPVGGYEEAPIQGAGAQTYAFYSDAKSAGNLMRILDSSPALRVGETIDQPLVSWPGTTGITIANVAFGAIETAAQGSVFQYANEAAEPYVWTAAASASGTPQTLGVHLVGSAHDGRITVSGSPANFAGSAEGWTPGYGDHDGYAAGEVTLTAPSGQVEDSADTRGTVTGWKRYVVDPETRERTFETSGTGATCTFAFDGAWREVEWQWAVEHRVAVTVNDAAKGSVSASQAWVAADGSVTITATPKEIDGYAFTRWTGDVDLSVCLEPTITVTGDGVKSLCANFGRVYYADGTYGNDATADGTDPRTPYKTITAAYAKAGSFDTVSVAEGSYSAALTLAKGVVVRGAGMERTVQKAAVVLDHADAVLADLRMTGVQNAGMFNIKSGSAGGTVLRCSSIGNSGTSQSGVGMCVYCGNVVDCVITNNTCGGNFESLVKGIGLFVGGGPTLVQGCLIADNRADSGCCTAFGVAGTGKVTIRGCRIVRNLAGSGPGLYIADEKSNVEVVDTIVSDNLKDTPATDAHSEDCYLGWAVGCSRTFRNVVIGKMPTCNEGYVFENCKLGYAGGFFNAWEQDYRITRCSVAWAGEGAEFDCGVSAETNWGLTNVTTTVHAKVVNAPAGEITYSWDFDNDGVFEIEGAGDGFAAQDHVFTRVGMNAVTLKVTVGGVSVTRRVENVVYVAPAVTYIWAQSPNPTFPYATWETASHNPAVAVHSVPDGGRLQFTNEQVKVADSIRVVRRMTVAGTGRDNDSNNNVVVPSDGTLVQHQSGNKIVFQIYNDGSLIHSMAIGPGCSHVVSVYRDSCVSNCVIRNGSYTSGMAIGADVAYGLVTHCVISNNTTGSNSSGGGSVVLSNGARLLNCYLTGANHTCTSGTGTRGTVYANDGCTVANCTIVGNKAGTGGGLYTTGKALVYNNIIRDNTAVVGYPDWYDETGTGVYVNNCMPTAHHEGDGTVTAEPAFLPGTITFEAGSPCANVGTNLEWMTEGSVDLFGNKRISGGRVDIGCFEADSEKAACDILAEPASVVGAVPVTLTAIVTGVSLDGKTVAYDWYLGDAETPFASGASVSHTFPGGAHDLRLVVTVDGEVLFDKTKPSSVTVYSQDVYLATENANAKFPYGTRETAATDFTAALEATPAGGTLHVLAGRHIVRKTISLDKEITVAADEGLETRPTLVRSGVSGSLLRVGHEQALVTGLVLDNNKQYPDVSIGSGTVRDCVISNAEFTSGTGIALEMTGGLCDRCEIVNCSGTDAYATAYGMVATLSGSAVFRNSLVHQCRSRGTGIRPGVVYVSGSATMENCTVVSNSCTSYSVVYVGGNATLRNNIIWGNDYAVLPGQGGEGGPNWLVMSDATPTLSNNCSPVALGANAVTDDPKFRDRKGRPYCFFADSPCIDAGLPCDWAKEPGALDFYGNPRKFGIRPDLGCVESQVGGMLLLVR